MSLFKVFDVAGTAMNAQSVRLNVTASNLANAGSVHGDPNQVYRARQPVFSSFDDALSAQNGVAGVRIDGIRESNAPLEVQY
ncbi:MAG: flagellar basal body rod protein FlgC, partial [Pseudomonadales bacterium]|nr:flagellar basal body rod protein FlgC [Pseudomonadales bacterium]